jgi:hypothetical protein
MKKKPTGRPPVDPDKKMDQPIRCLITPVLKGVLLEEAARLDIPVTSDGIVPSDFIRFCIAGYLKTSGKWNQIATDPTWKNLRELNLI